MGGHRCPGQPGGRSRGTRRAPSREPHARPAIVSPGGRKEGSGREKAAPSEAEAMVPAALAGEASGKSVTSGFPSLDSLLGGGLRRGDLVVLAGDVAVGKSALALAMTLRSAAAGQSAAFLTGEMSIGRVMERALAIEGRVRVDDLRRGGLDDVAHSGVAAAAISLRRQPPMFEDLHAGIDGVSDF